jgi:hypothetical protein
VNKSVYLVALSGGLTHTVEADEVRPESDGKSVSLYIGRQLVGHFFGVDSVVKQPAQPEAMPAPGLEYVSGVAELASFECRPAVSIGEINVTVSSIEEARGFVAEARAMMAAIVPRPV